MIIKLKKGEYDYESLLRVHHTRCIMKKIFLMIIKVFLLVVLLQLISTTAFVLIIENASPEIFDGDTIETIAICMLFLIYLIYSILYIRHSKKISLKLNVSEKAFNISLFILWNLVAVLVDNILNYLLNNGIIYGVRISEEGFGVFVAPALIYLLFTFLTIIFSIILEFFKCIYDDFKKA